MLSGLVSDTKRTAPGTKSPRGVKTRPQQTHSSVASASSTFISLALDGSAIAARPQNAGPQSSTGNQNLLLLLSGKSIQPKLAISTPGDTHEREADRVADAMMMGQPSAVVTNTNGSPVQRKCETCEQEDKLQRKTVSEETAEASARLENDTVIPGSGGQPLPESVRGFFEPRFGQDFSDVRIHTGGSAAESAGALNAAAFTLGRNVVFGANRYAPETGQGRRLLAHELTHVVQQRSAAVQRMVQRDLATPPPSTPQPAQPDLTDAQIREAIRFNRQFYDDANTRLIQNILGGPVTGTWTADNIRAIAATQEQFGLKKDGKVGPDTFKFITNEQTLEGAGTDTPNCLTAFRVIPFPVVQNATAGPGGTTQIQGHHKVEARFSDRCDCSGFEYRQFIAGVATASRGGATQDLSTLFSHIPGGRLPIASREDGNTTCPSQNYGHRNQPGQNSTTTACGEDHYTDDAGVTNQASGCQYRGEDFPAVTVNGLQTGDTVDLEVDFRGEIRRNGTVIQTRNWRDIDVTVVTP